jgi:hypothetical protein
VYGFKSIARENFLKLIIKGDFYMNMNKKFFLKTITLMIVIGIFLMGNLPVFGGSIFITNNLKQYLQISPRDVSARVPAGAQNYKLENKTDFWLSSGEWNFSDKTHANIDGVVMINQCQSVFNFHFLDTTKDHYITITEADINPPSGGRIFITNNLTQFLQISPGTASTIVPAGAQKYKLENKSDFGLSSGQWNFSNTTHANINGVVKIDQCQSVFNFHFLDTTKDHYITIGDRE